MAEKRMFTKKITQSDEFLSMPHSSQNLYFHLNMEADDEGFVNSPKKVMRFINASEDDLKILLGKRFILAFESGVIVIKHWKMHNVIRPDRIKETDYVREKAQLMTEENGKYRIIDGQMTDNCQTSVRQLTDKRPHSIEEISIEENRRVNNSRTFAPPSLEELIDFIREQGYQVNAETFLSHYESKGWYVGKNKMKDWKAAVRGWSAREKEKPKPSNREDILPEYEPTYQQPKIDDSVDRNTLIEQIRKGTK